MRIGFWIGDVITKDGVQQENNLPVREVYIDLENVSAMGEPKRYEVTGASIDLDYKP